MTSVIDNNTIPIYNPINYSIEIYPFADPTRKKAVILSSANNSNILNSRGAGIAYYFLESFGFGNDIFSPIQKGTARVIENNYINTTFFLNVREGDLLFVKENGGNIFTGYIESLSIDYSINGTTIEITFVNLLKQLSITKIFGTIFNVIQPAQGVKFGQFLDAITTDTIIGNIQDTNPLFTFDTYKGRGESGDLVITDDTTIYITITSYMTIFQAINKILFPYQRLIYQDFSGNIFIAPLSLYSNLSWIFSRDNNANSIPYINISIQKNAAAVNNLEYATLFTIPIQQDLINGNQSQLNSEFACQYSPPTQYFQRVNQLYNSGNFKVTDVIIEDLIGDPAKIDVTLNNISQIIQGSFSTAKSAGVTIASVNQTPKSQRPIVSQGNSDVSSILFNYAARAMAENLVNETSVTITSPRTTQRDSNNNLLPLPINSVVSLYLDNNSHPQGILETTSLYCRGYSIAYSEKNGTLVSLNLVKPLVGGAYWVNGQLT